MTDRLVHVTEGFWNIRGSFKLLHLVELGTQTSLVRLASGRFVLLDCYAFDEGTRAEVDRLTDDGAAIEAIVNLHPFHTMHCEAVAGWYPGAKLYGTARHVSKHPGLRWETTRVESAEMSDLFGGEFEFMVPDGVALWPADENVHAGSVLALHRPTRTLHVDDTLTWVSLPLVGGLRFHPTLGSALEPRAGAAAAFRAWAEGLVERCGGVEHLCAAHMKAPAELKGSGEIAAAVRAALDKVEGTLEKHAAKHG